ncbi:MAG: hypothetical protein WDM81_06875 [Rhizomicrobium sp.]
MLGDDRIEFRRHEGVDPALAAHHFREDAREVAAAGRQVHHAAAGPDAGEDDHLGGLALVIGLLVGIGPARIGDRGGDDSRRLREHRRDGQQCRQKNGGHPMA